jgi:hypothetical protein
VAKKEEQLSKSVSRYLKLQYPDVVFTCDSSGIRLTIGQATALKAQRSVHKIPDMIILKPNGEYHGLILELKSEDSSPYLKDGSLSKGQHIQEQNQTLTALLNIGYYAVFIVGFNQAKEVIDNYMANKL